ncbi:hypothetical protein DMB66_32815 [Actinoplanes sp. ATCC 53533]|nr:hypothetical protein DMB66_32815 [Actinoplanes sp. ATCC 53533]
MVDTHAYVKAARLLRTCTPDVDANTPPNVELAAAATLLTAIAEADLPTMRYAYDTSRHLHGYTHPDTMNAGCAYAEALADLGDAAALDTYRALIDGYCAAAEAENAPPPDPAVSYAVCLARTGYAQCLAAAGRRDDSSTEAGLAIAELRHAVGDHRSPFNVGSRLLALALRMHAVDERTRQRGGAAYLQCLAPALEGLHGWELLEQLAIIRHAASAPVVGSAARPPLADHASTVTQR